jgi:hypothetical protein
MASGGGPLTLLPFARAEGFLDFLERARLMDGRAPVLAAMGDQRERGPGIVREDPVIRNRHVEREEAGWVELEEEPRVPSSVRGFLAKPR